METLTDTPVTVTVPAKNARMDVQREWLEKHVGCIVDRYMMDDVDKVIFFNFDLHLYMDM